jgi:hypothetical protein
VRQEVGAARDLHCAGQQTKAERTREGCSARASAQNRERRKPHEGTCRMATGQAVSRSGIRRQRIEQTIELRRPPELHEMPRTAVVRHGAQQIHRDNGCKRCACHERKTPAQRFPNSIAQEHAARHPQHPAGDREPLDAIVKQQRSDSVALQRKAAAGRIMKQRAQPEIETAPAIAPQREHDAGQSNRHEVCVALERG